MLEQAMTVALETQRARDRLDATEVKFLRPLPGREDERDDLDLAPRTIVPLEPLPREPDQDERCAHAPRPCSGHGMSAPERGAAESLAPLKQRLEQRGMTHGLVLERTLDELVERGLAAPVPQFEEVERGVGEWGDLGDRHGLLPPSRPREVSRCRTRRQIGRASCRERGKVWGW